MDLLWDSDLTEYLALHGGATWKANCEPWIYSICESRLMFPWYSVSSFFNFFFLFLLSVLTFKKHPYKQIMVVVFFYHLTIFDFYLESFSLFTFM